MVEAQMRSDRVTPVQLVVSEVGTLLAEDDASAGDLWGLPSTRTVRRAEMRRRQRQVLTYLGLAAAGALVVALFISRRPQPASATSADARASAATEPLPKSGRQPRNIEERVRVSIEARPLQARIFWDSEPLAGNPYVGELPRDGLPHVLRVEAAGFRTQWLTVGLKDPIVSLVELVPEPTASPVRPTPTTTRSASEHPAAARSTGAGAPHPLAACTPPFTFDPNGIKRFKPECLN